MFSKKIPKYSTLNMETLNTCDHVNEGWKIHESSLELNQGVKKSKMSFFPLFDLL